MHCTIDSVSDEKILWKSFNKKRKKKKKKNYGNVFHRCNSISKFFLQRAKK